MNSNRIYITSFRLCEAVPSNRRIAAEIAAIHTDIGTGRGKGTEKQAQVQAQAQIHKPQAHITEKKVQGGIVAE